MKAHSQDRFWNSFAIKYDSFIERYAKATYAQTIKLLKEELSDQVNVLEIGTGTGLIAFAIADQVNKLLAIDFAPEMIQIAREKLLLTPYKHIIFEVGGANQIDVPDQSFDVVIASNVFHLLPNASEVLLEIRRVLKSNGKVILPTYCHGENLKSIMISLFMGLSGFKAVNRWSTSQFRHFVESNGFVIEQEVIIDDRIPLSFLTATKQN